MPRVYYRELAEGLMPLGYSSSDDEEGPCELPDVCDPHGLVYCTKCCTDCSDMKDLLDDDEGEEEEEEDVEEDEDELSDEAWDNVWRSFSLIPELVRGTGKGFPSKFEPSNSDKTPLEEFPNRRRYMAMVRRTHSSDNTKLLLMADGACLSNGQSNPKAGWALFQGESTTGEPAVVSRRLENRGPWRAEGGQTSSRAELRAAIAGLRFKAWQDEGFKTVVIATDSTYVVDGATHADVENKDLWEALLGECERAHGHGLAIQFWHVPHEWNTLADEGAKKGAAEGDAPDRWSDVVGVAF